MSYRAVDEAFWTDPKVRSLTQQEKFLFLYFITNPHASFSGLYYLPIPTVIFETGLLETAVREGINTLSVGSMVLHDEPNSLFWVVNMARFNVLSKPQRDGIARHFGTLQKSFLLDLFEKRYPSMVRSKYPSHTLSIPTDTLSIPPDNPTDISFLKEKKRKEKDTLPPTLPSVGFVFPESLKTPEFEAAWKNWESYRKEMKKPLKEPTTKAQLAKCAKIGPEAAVRLLEKSIFNGWQGLFPGKDEEPEPAVDDQLRAAGYIK